MFSLREYREPNNRLSDLLPWAALIGPGLILQKDAILQKTFAIRGPDVLSSSPHELGQLALLINNALMRLGSGWSIFVEAQRYRTSEYPESRCENLAAWVVDLERANHFAQGGHFDSTYYLTFVWKMPSDRSSRLVGFFYEDAGGSAPAGDPRKEMAGVRRDLDVFLKTIREIVTLLEPLLPMLVELGDDETLTYLHSTISTQRHPVKKPDIPFYLDAILADEPFTSGESPMLGDHYVLSCTVSGFPAVSSTGMLDALNYLQTEYRWSTRYIALDKGDAQRLIEEFRRKWTRARKGIWTMLKEHAAGGEESRLQNDAAIDKADDASEALRELGNDEHAYGYFTTSITVWDKDPREVRAKLQLVKQAVQARGFTVLDETVNSREAWLGSLPGNVYANVRRPVISTLNLAHLIPASSVWKGAAHNAHLAKVTGGVGLPHVLCSTTGATPFALNLNVEDLGHTLILGPPGAGKSTLLALLALQWLKYPKAQVVIFDKDRSARAATLAAGGVVFEPGSETAPLAFQPLAALDGDADRAWAAQFALTLFAAQGVAVTPALQEDLDSALDSLKTRPRPERTISALAHVLESFDPKYSQALRPYCSGGAFGQIFDADEDRVAPTAWTLFEMGHLMQMGPAAIVPALFYLFRRVEQQFTGAPTLLVLDEAWLFLTHSVFADRLMAWLKTLRKKNVFVVFATQEVADASRNPVLQSTILSACPTKIFLADPEATTPAMAAEYAKLGLTPTEIGTLAAMRKKRDYYLRSTEGRRIFNLELGPAQLAFVGMSSPRDQQFLDRLVATQSPRHYVTAMLEQRGVQWALDAIRQLHPAAAAVTRRASSPLYAKGDQSHATP
jgi:type IV secretion system protein TrbE